jgi:hypothetical protein
MAKLGDLVAVIGANTSGFNKALGDVQRNTRKMTGNIQQLGKQMSMAITLPVAALGVTSVKAFDKQAKAIAQVEAGLRSTGNAVGYTSKQLQDMASEMQNSTLFGDEQILKDATAQLLTFTNLSKDEFKRTQKAALDLATRLDGDLKSASIQLGKALNDPVKNLSALSRSGIQFSDEQKTLINSLAETGQMAEAQRVILSELEKQYGGSAEAAAAAGLGPMQQLANAFGDLQEQFGEIILEFAVPLVDFFKRVVSAMQEMSPMTKKIILAITGLAAAAGPLLVILPQIVSAAPLVGAAFTAMTGPIGIAVVAVAAAVAAIIANWDEIQAYFTSGKGSEFMTSIKTSFSKGWDSIKAIWNAGVDLIMMVWEKFGDNYLNSIMTPIEMVMNLFEFVFTNISSMISFYSKLFQGDFAGAFDELENVAANTVNFVIDTILSMAKVALNTADAIAKAFGGDGFYDEAVAGLEKFAEGLRMTEDQADDTSDAVDSLAEKSSGFGGWSMPTPTSSSGSGSGGAGVRVPIEIEPIEPKTITDALSNIETPTLQVSAVVDIPDDAIDPEKVAALEEQSQAIGGAVAGAFSDMSNKVVNSLGLADSGFEGFTKSLAGTATQLISTFLAQSIAAAIAGSQQSAAATGPGAIVTSPAFLSTMVGGVLAAFASIPAFADGGIVSGPTMGLMGEYSGARNNPEVIAPLDKLRGMISDAAGGGGGGGTLTTRLKGSDLVFALERAQKDMGRNR